MIDLCNKLVDNDLAREDLLGRVEIRKTSVEDLEQICKVLAMNTPETLHGTIALTAAPASLRIRVKSTRFKPNLSNDGRNDCPGRIIAR